MHRDFPFSAIVAQERLKSALLVNTVDPSIGGVLIRGEKGSGKSTAVRALRRILPSIDVVAGCPYHCPPDAPEAMHDGCRARWDAGEMLPREVVPTPFVDVPLNATEDRLAGTLHLERALEAQELLFDPGLLARANRGVLYVDEVNLLEDHLVDVLLDAAAVGTNIVEREGISHCHPSRFILVGTMNPEEGEVRPQLLDRFGLCVTVEGLSGTHERMEVVRRWTEFEANPEEFCAAWAETDAALSRRIKAARRRLRDVAVPDEMVHMAVCIAARAGVQGHRPDIVMVKTARALAALLERQRISQELLFEAARLVLAHRMQNALLGSPEETESEIDGILRRTVEHDGLTGGRASPEHEGDEDETEEMQVPGSAAAGSILLSLFEPVKKKTAEQHLTSSASDAH